MRIEGSVAVVTGGASGIGRASALGFAAAGADVVVADVDLDGAQSTAGEIEALGRRALALPADVGRRDEVEDMVARSIDWQGRVEVFLSNAGVGCDGRAEDFSVTEWESILAVDLMASIWAVRLLVPHMLQRGRGHISFVSSGAGIEGQATRAPYNVAKFGLVGLAESLVRQLEGSGVEVSVVLPGAVSTNGWRIYRVAGADEKTPEEIEAARARFRDDGANWPSPQSMAATIVTGIEAGRFCIAQHNPWDADWIGTVFRAKADDWDAAVRA